MAQVITIAGERLFALKAQNNEQLDIDTFIFANVPGQDPNATIDRNEGLPPVAQRVHQQIVQQVGRINDNVVVYSTVLDSVTGPFDFNWVGLYSSANQTLIAVSHIPNVSKTITVPGTAGNTLNRNFGIEYSGIADLAGITVQPETWQLDFTARLSGMDELTRQLAADMNGKDWFIGDGFKVVPRSTTNTFKVTPGAGYVSGLRVELKQDHILTLQSYPQFVYVDAWFDGDASSKWAPKTAFTVTNGEMDDYIDVNGKPHYVFKLARITAADVVEDLRGISDIVSTINEVKAVPIKDEFYQVKASDISAKLEEHGNTVVITGDSLSFNNYGYNFAYELNAYDCYPGIRSWSFMLRDYIHTCDRWFVYGDNISFTAEHGNPQINKASESSFKSPFNGRVTKLKARTQDDVISFMVRSANIQSTKTVIYMMHNEEGDQFKFDVYCDEGTGAAFASTLTIGDKSEFKKFAPFELVLSKYSKSDKPIKVSFKNFRNIDDSPIVGESGYFFVNAVGTKQTNIKLTGKGGATSADILEEYQVRIGQYAPDILIMQLGANDRLMLTLDEHIYNLRSIILNAKADNPNVQIILMNSTPGNPALLPNHYPDNVRFNGFTMREMVEAEKRLGTELDVIFLDTYRYFYDQKNYLHDQIHLNRYGNSLWFKAILSKLCIAGNGLYSHFHGTQYYRSGTLMAKQARLAQSTEAVIKPKGYAIFSMNSGVWEITEIGDYEGVISSFGKPAGFNSGALEITINYVTLRSEDENGLMFTCEQTGTVTKFLSCFQRIVGRQSIHITIADLTTSPPVVASDTTLENEQILVKWF
ncbi:phage tail protein [Shewanella vesiculosa]|uniref:phage tail-collar fiber domain-containing protein n=1 Tax=Shewanella vesiculosa TaxID=518738 RepID=UPI001404CBA9|nr:phage tail protein [Shewanella vesiculosa]UJL44341.1 phage tail protein [Shewanella vesiculosa]